MNVLLLLSQKQIEIIDELCIDLTDRDFSTLEVHLNELAQVIKDSSVFIPGGNADLHPFLPHHLGLF